MTQPSARRGRQLPAGFTLIELLVTMVIVAILASIAMPMYQSSVRKSRRTEAKLTALDAAAREERYYATQNQYTTDLSQLGYTTTAGSSAPFTTGTYYEISAITTSAPTASSTGVTTGSFSITVAPFSGSTQAADTTCETWVITQTGQKTATGNDSNPSVDCWN